MARPRKPARKALRRYTPNDALQGAIVIMCKQPLWRRLQLCWVIITAKYANAIELNQERKRV